MPGRKYGSMPLDCSDANLNKIARSAMPGYSRHNMEKQYYKELALYKNSSCPPITALSKKYCNTHINLRLLRK